MKTAFENVRLAALGMHLPAESVSSLEIEARLSPCYEKFSLLPGRLELMTGIRHRRFFAARTLPSDIATAAAEDLFSRVPQLRGEINVLIHASVCRNFLEPATAAVVHHNLKLSPSCLLFDLSNACLSWVNALAVGAAMIESGQAHHILVVSGEEARSVVDNTIHFLNGDTAATRETVKKHLATLTLGSGGSAALLSSFANCRRDTGAKILGGAFRSATAFSPLCQSRGETMETDSEAMLHAGVTLAVETWSETRAILGWSPHLLTGFVPHQVGKAHAELMKARLELAHATEFSTFAEFGNMGAASIGVTLTDAARRRQIAPQSRLALLGIGSGLVCGMLGMEWNEGAVA